MPTPPAVPPATGEASWRMVVPEGTTRYQLAMGDVSSGATPFQRVTPIYPATLLVTCPSPREVQALLIVDTSGDVGEVRVDGEAQMDAVQRQFIAAVRTAARQWQFSPLQITHWAADAGGNSHVVDREARPFSLAYVFRFECHAGQAVISSEAAAPGS